MRALSNGILATISKADETRLAACPLPRDNRAGAGRTRALPMLRRPRVWLPMACFGLVNGGYATAVAWLAPFCREHGWGAAAGGSLLAAMAATPPLAALFLPILARSRDLRPWLWLTLAMQAAGFAALALRPEAAPLASAMLLGAGLGGCFSLSTIVVGPASYAGAMDVPLPDRPSRQAAIGNVPA